MADEKIDEREAAITARMTESRGALNRAQAEIAVAAQIADDAAKEDAAKAEAKKKKAN